MAEKTTQELYDKLIEASNIILGDIHLVKNQNAWSKEHMEYIHSNTLNTFRMLGQLQEELKSLKN